MIIYDDRIIAAVIWYELKQTRLYLWAALMPYLSHFQCRELDIQRHPVQIIMSVSCFITVYHDVFDNQLVISRCFEQLENNRSSNVHMNYFIIYFDKKTLWSKICFLVKSTHKHITHIKTTKSLSFMRALRTFSRDWSIALNLTADKKSMRLNYRLPSRFLKGNE